MNEFSFKKHGFVFFDNPKEIQEKAKFYGQKRTEANAQLHKDAPEYDRGSRSAYVDELGVTAELIAIIFFDQQNILFEVNIIFDEKPVKFADIYTADFKIDVKGVSNANELRVNLKTHYEKEVTHYIFIKPQYNDDDELIGEAEYWIISALYPSCWKINNKADTPFLFMPIIEAHNIYFNEE